MTVVYKICIANRNKQGPVYTFYVANVKIHHYVNQSALLTISTMNIHNSSNWIQLLLTHWGWDKMAAISQTTFSSAFSWMKTFDFPLNFLLKFVPTRLINNIPALGQIMAWRRSGDKPLSETMMVILPTHICVTRPQWVITTVINNHINITTENNDNNDLICQMLLNECWQFE